MIFPSSVSEKSFGVVAVIVENVSAEINLLARFPKQFSHLESDKSCQVVTRLAHNRGRLFHDDATLGESPRAPAGLVDTLRARNRFFELAISVFREPHQGLLVCRVDYKLCHSYSFLADA